MKRALLPLAAVSLVVAVLVGCDPDPKTLPIQHIVVLMMENHSADTYLGQLHDQGQPDFEAEPTTGNPNPLNPGGPPIGPFHKTSLCEVADLDHSWNGAHIELDGGKLDGFTARNEVTADPTGSRAMGYYDQRDLPYYYALYNTFATSDRHFSSLLGPTFPNRLFLYAGTAAGHISNNFILSNLKSIFELMDQYGVSWRIYQSQSLNYGASLFSYVLLHQSGHVFPVSQYYADAAAGTLPQVSFVDPDLFTLGSPTQNDEHPDANVQEGQKFEASVTNALIASPEWSSSAMFLTYDENGGFYDHVVPPAAPIPDNIPPATSSSDFQAAYDQYGYRVPFLVISPWAKPHYVSHTVGDHTSILHFIEWRFGMPSLTNRDAKANLLLDEFDFSSPHLLTPPALPTPTVTPC